MARQIESEKRIRALSFGGGGFDTVMQLGVAHALLVSNGKPPDYVVGISAGAINAAALAEVMQSGEDLPEEQQLAARVRRLREFVNSYVEVPQQIFDSTFPDTFEINAQKALHPIELPVHFDTERQSRDDANRSRAGLIHLLNHLLRIRLTVAAATRMIRRLLAIAESGEKRRPKRFRETRVWNYIGIWLAAFYYSFPLSRIAFSVVWAASIGSWRRTDKRSAGDIILTVHLLGAVVKTLRLTLSWAIYMMIWLLPLAVILAPAPDWTEVVVDRIIDRVDIPDTPVASLVEGMRETVLHGMIPFRPVIPDVIEETLREAVLLAGDTIHIAVDALESFADTNLEPLLLAAVFLLVALLLDWALDVPVSYVVLAYLCARAFDPFHWMPVLLGLVVAAGAYVLLKHGAWGTRMLEYYQIGDGLLSADVLKQELVKRFDPDYYGRPVLNEMIDTALSRGKSVNEGTDRYRKTVDGYANHKVAIRVAPVAADLSTGRLMVLPGHTAVVDALLAATAVAPLFPAHNPELKEWQEREKQESRRAKFGGIFRRGKKREGDPRWYIDGLNVSNEPIQPLLDHMRNDFEALRSKRNRGGLAADERERLQRMEAAETVDIYSVSDLPIDHGELESRGEYSTLVEVGLRAMELKEFRDATMERRLTRLYTKALPLGKAFQDGPDRTMIHANVFPIELDRPARVNRRLMRGANNEAFRRILHEAVADGCRAALDAMIPAAILNPADLSAWVKKHLADPAYDQLRARSDLHRALAHGLRGATPAADGGTVTIDGLPPDGQAEITIPRVAFDELVVILAPRCVDVIQAVVGRMLPGAEPAYGPGVSEVCRNCRLYRPDDGLSTIVPVRGRTEPAPHPVPFDDEGRLRAHVRRASEWPQWPLPQTKSVRAPEVPPAVRVRPDREHDWSHFPDLKGRPTVSFLFGGGVFRGVFHMGVMNALNEVGLQPDLVAGSSVGSIIAAMVASVFKSTSLVQRQLRIRSLAATFLSIDRFVLTDRLSDFVRRLTLRAAEAEFSPRDLDLLLRRYDADLPARFNQRMRKALAGLERLLYLSPFELLEIVRSARLRDTPAVLAEVIGDIQELLDRGGVGLEVLGSEPLSLLIKLHVEEPLQRLTGNRQEPRFETYLEGENKIYFMATTTNLARGALEILNAPFPQTRNVSLAYGLLASSAFPAVFRPRQSWEIFLGTSRENRRYIDGGVIDNLPLDAVARLLDDASRPGADGTARVDARPVVPHLLFTASLEPDRDVLPMRPEDVEKASRNFMTVSDRAKTFQHNRKIDAYRAVQERLNRLYDYHKGGIPWNPLKLTVITVKPKWLCGTFGFHPMLGFRRRKQAQSIAHGCASTLAHLAKSTSDAATRKAWKMRAVDFDDDAISHIDIAGTGEKREELRPQHHGKTAGQCWFRKGDHMCPFSREWRLSQRGGDDQNPDVRPEELRESNEIYEQCGRRATHEPAH